MAERGRARPEGGPKRARRRAGRPEAPGEPGAGRAEESREVELPGWLPAVVFLTLTAYLFRAFVFTDQMLFGGDTLGLGYVARAFYADALRELGTIPRWAPDILGGTPFLEALSGGDSLYPPSLVLLLLLEPYRALGWKLVLHFAAAGFFMVGWVRAIGGSRPAALLAGTAYLLAPFFVGFVHPGHDGKIFVIALAPLLFLLAERHFVRPRIWTFGALALVVGLILLTTHFQMAYFLFGGVGAFAIFRAIQIGRGVEGGAVSSPPGGSRPRAAAARFGLFLGASLLGAGVGGVQLLPAVDYVLEHSRRTHTTGVDAAESGIAWSSSWSMHPEEAMSLVVPQFAGNHASGAGWASGTYWGRNPFKDNHEYVGLVVLLLAAVSFAGGARPGLRWFFAGLGGVALLFSLGLHTPVWRLFYEVVPGIRLFRAPAQAMFLFGFGAITLAALGLDRLLGLVRSGDEAGWRRTTRLLGWSAAALALLALLIASGTFTTVWQSAIYPGISGSQLEALDRLQPYLTGGAVVSALLAAAVWGLAVGARARRLSASSLVAGLVLLAAFDALRVDSAFVEVLDFHEWSAPDPNLRAVLEREQGSEEPYRLLSFRRNAQDVMPALHGIELAAGHHPNDLARYRELIGMEGSGMPVNLQHPNVRSILNVRYILWPDLEMGGSIQGPVVSQTTLGDGRPYETIFEDAGLPRARLVASATVVDDEAAVAHILSDAFDPEREVVLNAPPPMALDGGPVEGSVRWIRRTPNTLRLAVESDRPALLVLAESWFPAWRATVSGQEAPVLRANHALRAVPVPAGASDVELTYHSSLVTGSFWLSMILAVGVVGATAASLVRDRRDRRRSDAV